MSSIEEIHEPVISASMLVPNEFIGNVITLCEQKRGKQIKISYVGGQALIEYYLPLNEVVLDFFDKLKSCTKGYASFDYFIHSFEKSDSNWFHGFWTIFFGSLYFNFPFTNLLKNIKSNSIINQK